MPWAVFLIGGCGQKHVTVVPTGVVGAHEKGHPQARRVAASAPHERDYAGLAGLLRSAPGLHGRHGQNGRDLLILFPAQGKNHLFQNITNILHSLPRWKVLPQTEQNLLFTSCHPWDFKGPILPFAVTENSPIPFSAETLSN